MAITFYSWQESGFPDVTNLDYVQSAFTLNNAALEYYSYYHLQSDSERKSFIDSNAQVRMFPYPEHLYDWPFSRLFDYAPLTSTNWYGPYYVWNHRTDGNFDLTGKQESILREWTDTPNGPLLLSESSIRGTYMFLAELARQFYQVLSGPVYAFVNVYFEEDEDREDFKVSISNEDLDRYSQIFSSAEYCIGTSDIGTGYWQDNTHGEVKSGTEAYFQNVERIFGIVRGIPRNSYWVGKR